MQQLQLFCHREMEQSRREMFEMVDLTQAALLEELLEASGTSRYRRDSSTGDVQLQSDIDLGYSAGEAQLEKHLMDGSGSYCDVEQSPMHHHYAQLPADAGAAAVADEERRRMIDRIIAKDEENDEYGDDSDDSDYEYRRGYSAEDASTATATVDSAASDGMKSTTRSSGQRIYL